MILLWSGKDYYELLEDAAQQKNYEIVDMSISLLAKLPFICWSPLWTQYCVASEYFLTFWNRDVTAEATGSTAVAPIFSDTLILFQQGGADSAQHCKVRTKNSPTVTSLMVIDKANFFIELETSILGYLLVLDFGKLYKSEPDCTNFIFDIL